ncbi:hypothetical protein ACHAXT_006719 [Thalassiosira profunda]
MSRRRGEFEHRTSIFEGAFRAWSHLGGLDPALLESHPAADLDPFAHPLIDDPRLAAQNAKVKTKREAPGLDGRGGGGGDAAPRREFAYEPLPRSGLAHPFVQAILSPWLGPDADQDAIQLGLTTLRTWWQHRRKGESGSAVVALNTEKMRGVVEGYTRHFFNLAHCLVVNDKEQPPRTLQSKMKDVEKGRSKKSKKRSRDDDAGKAATLAYSAGFGGGESGDLDRLQEAQRRNLADAGGVHSQYGLPDPAATHAPPIETKGRCVPGKVDLPGLVQQVSSAATQLAHRGIGAHAGGGIQTSSHLNNVDPAKYGDPNVTPVVVVSPDPTTGDKECMFLMSIDGITCAHCVKIVETVLKGCHGSRSPIDGLLDAAADMELHVVLIKVAHVGDCRRIAHEAARNLSMVGYTAKAKSVTLQGGATLHDVYAIMEQTIPALSPMAGFGWGYECGCPDNNVLRQDCPRHSQMGPGAIEVFDKTEQLLTDFVNGCTKKTGIPCTAGVHCFCGSHGAAASNVPSTDNLEPLPAQPSEAEAAMYHQQNGGEAYMSYQQPIQDAPPHDNPATNRGDPNVAPGSGGRKRQSLRMSFGGMGGLGRHLSMTSETTFGRAMSGLSALSIDWENMEDFDINVDHSAGINNDVISQQKAEAAAKDGDGEPAAPQPEEDEGLSAEDAAAIQRLAGGGGPLGSGGPAGGTSRRSSLKRNIPTGPNAAQQAYNVKFNMEQV